ncbi:lysozyme inhibitor LprI family protein [Pelagibacterium mangrovi]|uniref:lysozyme inhibitor LprI family protein n=1 Tax=Pelagibacterium mangrovi TaxID=3119828 RepID=UPI002FCC1935
MRTVILTALLIASVPAAAQDTPTFTPEDAELMTACIDGLADPELSKANPDEVRPQTNCIGAASNPCMENEEGGYSTIGMAECVGRETNWWDSQLNVHYASLEETLDADLFASLRDAQRSWLAYRDASCGFEYELWSEGTIRTLVYAGCILDSTAQRAYALSGYVNRPQ